MLRMTMTKWALLSLMATDGTASIVLPDGREGYLLSLLREDGSGRKFIATVMAPTGTRVGSPGSQLVMMAAVKVFITTD